MCRINGIIQYATLCVWLLSLSRIFWRLVCDWKLTEGLCLFIVIIQVTLSNLKLLARANQVRLSKASHLHPRDKLTHAKISAGQTADYSLLPVTCRHTNHIFETQVRPLGCYYPRIPSLPSLRSPPTRRGPEVAAGLSNFKWMLKAQIQMSGYWYNINM